MDSRTMQSETRSRAPGLQRALWLILVLAFVAGQGPLRAQEAGAAPSQGETPDAEAEEAIEPTRKKRKEKKKKTSRKTDILLLVNGDNLTGEIKLMQFGMLRLSTDSMGAVEIQWSDILEVTSQWDLHVEVTSGRRFLGSLEPGSGPRSIRVVGDTATTELQMASVVEIRPIKRSFWGRLQGSMSLGATFQKASNLATATFESYTTYRERKYETALSLFYTLTEQETGTTARSSFSLSYKRLLGNRLFANGVGALQQNELLGIQLRTIVIGSFGRYLVRSTRQDFSLAGGLAVNREQVTDNDPSQTSLEGVFAVAYDTFKYKSPKRDVRLMLVIFPSITEYDRVRVEFDTTLRWELASDFFWSLTLYQSYDSKPPGQETKSNDVGFTTALGWSFG
jgi:Protein of unknown function, DUF481